MNKCVVFLISILFLYSCKSKEDKAKDVVAKFLTEINDTYKEVDKNLMTKQFDSLLHNQGYFLSQDWKLSLKNNNDSLIVFEAKSETHNGFGNVIEKVQYFYLEYLNGSWKIYDSHNFISNKLDFFIVNYNWSSLTDIEQNEIIEDLKDKLELKILVPAYGNIYNDSKKGKLKLINNSDFDIKDVTVQIEHFDKNGQSVNINNKIITDIIRSHGYREFEWYTSNCSECHEQDFKIIFSSKENN